MSHGLVHSSYEDILKIIEFDYKCTCFPAGRLRQLYAILSSPNLHRLRPQL